MSSVQHAKCLGALPPSVIHWMTKVFHNLILSLGSLIMFLGTCLELLQRWLSSGHADWFFCEDPKMKAVGPLYFWSYVYYLSKYYEMFDTVLVLLQKSFDQANAGGLVMQTLLASIFNCYSEDVSVRANSSAPEWCFFLLASFWPLLASKRKSLFRTNQTWSRFNTHFRWESGTRSRVPHFKLQVYHHAAVVPMAWLWCEYQQSLQWGGLLFNTLVHVIMQLGTCFWGHYFDGFK